MTICIRKRNRRYDKLLGVFSDDIMSLHHVFIDFQFVFFAQGQKRPAFEIPG